MGQDEVVKPVKEWTELDFFDQNLHLLFDLQILFASFFEIIRLKN